MSQSDDAEIGICKLFFSNFAPLPTEIPLLNPRQQKKTTPSYRHLAIRLLHRRISPSSSTPKLFWGWKKTFIRRHDEPRWGIIGPSSKLMMAIVTLCVQSIKRVWPSHYRSAKIKRKQQNSIFIPLGSSYNFVVVVVKLSYQPL